MAVIQIQCCRNCEERMILCHSFCKVYIQAKADAEKIKAEKSGGVRLNRDLKNIENHVDMTGRRKVNHKRVRA